MRFALGTPAPAIFCTCFMAKLFSPVVSLGGALLSATSTSPLGRTYSQRGWSSPSANRSTAKPGAARGLLALGPPLDRGDVDRRQQARLRRGQGRIRAEPRRVGGGVLGSPRWRRQRRQGRREGEGEGPGHAVVSGRGWHSSRHNGTRACVFLGRAEPISPRRGHCRTVRHAQTLRSRCDPRGDRARRARVRRLRHAHRPGRDLVLPGLADRPAAPGEAVRVGAAARAGRALLAGDPGRAGADRGRGRALRRGRAAPLSARARRSSSGCAPTSTTG